MESLGRRGGSLLLDEDSLSMIGLWNGNGMVSLAGLTFEALLDWYCYEFGVSERVARRELRPGVQLGITVEINGERQYVRGELVFANVSIPVLP